VGPQSRYGRVGNNYTQHSQNSLWSLLSFHLSREFAQTYIIQ